MPLCGSMIRPARPDALSGMRMVCRTIFSGSLPGARFNRVSQSATQIAQLGRLAPTSLCDPGGALYSAEEMTPKQRLGIAFRSVAHGGVPAAAALDCLAPRDRLIAAHFAA